MVGKHDRHLEGLLAKLCRLEAGDLSWLLLELVGKERLALTMPCEVGEGSDSRRVSVPFTGCDVVASQHDRQVRLEISPPEVLWGESSIEEALDVRFKADLVREAEYRRREGLRPIDPETGRVVW